MCPAFVQGPLAAFQAKVMNAIRAVDGSRLLFLRARAHGAGRRHRLRAEPHGHPRAGMSFHDYCALSVLVAGLSCDQGEELILTKGLDHANANGGPGLVTEFGGTNDPLVLNRMTDRLDRHMTSWQFWVYNEQLVPDTHLAPGGTNVVADRLARVVRPYPQVVTRTPQEYPSTATRTRSRCGTRRNVPPEARSPPGR
ncbi:MAG: cellulase family glycosylhydrolase [Actinomycetota bacterium]|nr:cellulase family glycosylhydrolase [Actinomycetota bacterium]